MAKGLGLKPELNPQNTLNNSRLFNRDEYVDREQDQLAVEEDNGKAILIVKKKTEAPDDTKLFKTESDRNKAEFKNESNKREATPSA